VLDSAAAEQDAEWFNSFEQAHDVVFYRGDAPDSPWTHLCLRQADRIFLLASADRPLPPRPLDLPAFKERASGLPELLLLQPQNGPLRLPDRFSSRSGLFQGHHHIRSGHARDIGRIARFIAGRAIGPGLRPYRHHQGPDGGRCAFRPPGRHLDGRHHRGRPGP
jgi:NTE family protein